MTEKTTKAKKSKKIKTSQKQQNTQDVGNIENNIIPEQIDNVSQTQNSPLETPLQQELHSTEDVRTDSTIDKCNQDIVIETPKRGRGRPRKVQIDEILQNIPLKKKRGRPSKNVA